MMHPEIEKFYVAQDKFSIVYIESDPDTYYLTENNDEECEMITVSEVIYNRRIYFLPNNQEDWHTEEEMLKIIRMKSFL